MTARRALLAIVALCFALTVTAVAQYTDPATIEHLGGPQEFAARRADLAKKLEKGYVLLFARTELPEANHYREDNDFFYLTGLADPESVLLIDVAKGRTAIFQPEQHPRLVQVLGPNLLAMGKQKQKEMGYDTVLPLSQLEPILSYVLAGEADLWVRLGYPDVADGAREEVGRFYAARYNLPYGGLLPQDREALRQLRERYPAAHLRDLTPILDEMRNIKRPGEIEVLRRNARLSAEGHRRALARAHPGMYQYQVEADAAYVFRSSGAQGVAYPAIVGSGENANTWHYFSNRKKINAGDLVVFDYGADLDQLTVDITRTFNIDGKFTPEQAKWYRVVLDSQNAIIEKMRPGNTYEEAADAGYKVFKDAGYDEWYPGPHGFPGHFVGLATHDVLRPAGPVKAGHVVAVEPIIEFPDKHWHFRIEDTVLVTENGPEILSSAAPRELKDVEALVGSEAGQKP